MLTHDTTSAPWPTVTLSDGADVPQLGFGTYGLSESQVDAIVPSALEAGYRHFDTAVSYGNERALGAALSSAGAVRDELFLVTKVHNADQGRARATDACRRSLDKLGVDYLDLYLIHWLLPGRDLFVETWEALIELREAGLVRSIGVSNFTAEAIERLIRETGVAPVVNQVETHPYFPQNELRSFLRVHDIAHESWSPLAAGSGLREEDAVLRIARDLDVTPAQVVIAWHLQRGSLVIPRSSDGGRVAENARSREVTLSAEQLSAIDGLERGQRRGPDPATADFDQPIWS